jgi:hypothetical protein
MIMNDKDDSAVKGVKSVIGQWCQEEFQVLYQCQSRNNQTSFTQANIGENDSQKSPTSTLEIGLT